MSGLKSAWEISLEKSNTQNPELKNKKKLTNKQKSEIAEIRKDYEAKIADLDLTLDHKLKKLVDRVPPDRLDMESEALKKEFLENKEILEKEREKKIKVIRNA